MIIWKKSKRGEEEIWWPYVKYYAEGRTKRPSPLWNDLDGNKKAARDVRALFSGKKIFDFPKPVPMIERCIRIAPNSSKDDIILDFFAGSAATAHAVMKMNAEDGGSRRFIQVQLPEPTEKSSEAFKFGLKTIADIGRERIVRAGGKLKEEMPEAVADFGFKYFKLAESNIRAWSPDRSDLESSLLLNKEHLIDGRTEQDVLYELLLKRGIELTVPIEERNSADKTIYSIGFGVLFACLDTSIKADDVDTLAQGIIDWHKELEPETDTHVFFRDSAFADDITKTNMAAILEQNGITHVRSL